MAARSFLGASSKAGQNHLEIVKRTPETLPTPDVPKIGYQGFSGLEAALFAERPAPVRAAAPSVLVRPQAVPLPIVDEQRRPFLLATG